jgi:hypothetical protein
MNLEGRRWNLELDFFNSKFYLLNSEFQIDKNK